jgi:hypothetical protein
MRSYCKVYLNMAYKRKRRRKTSTTWNHFSKVEVGGVTKNQRK